MELCLKGCQNIRERNLLERRRQLWVDIDTTAQWYSLWSLCFPIGWDVRGSKYIFSSPWRSLPWGHLHNEGLGFLKLRAQTNSSCWNWSCKIFWYNNQERNQHSRRAHFKPLLLVPWLNGWFSPGNPRLTICSIYCYLVILDLDHLSPDARTLNCICKIGSSLANTVPQSMLRDPRTSFPSKI